MIATLPVRVVGYSPQPTEAVLRVDHLVPGRRVGRAVGSFAKWFVAAILSVFVPAAHFLLVPGCLVGAFVALVVRLGQSDLVLDARGTCPDCGLEQDLDVGGTWRVPMDIACRGCRRRLTLVSHPPPS